MLMSFQMVLLSSAQCQRTLSQQPRKKC
ncbi:hypothetical protein [Christiangramia sp. OXR-203]